MQLAIHICVYVHNYSHMGCCVAMHVAMHVHLYLFGIKFNENNSQHWPFPFCDQFKKLPCYQFKKLPMQAKPALAIPILRPI